VLGLRARSPLPEADESTLLRYYQYLATRLALPFKARHCPEAEPGERVVTVVAILDPREWDRGTHLGLLCAVRLGGVESIAPLFELEVGDDHPNFQLLEDYWYWFWNWRNRTRDRWVL
jgi:hypothetical protein